MNNEINVLDIPLTTKYWFVRANSHSLYYEDFKYNNFIAIDSNHFKLSKLFEIPSTLRSSEDALLDRYKQLFQEHDIKIFNRRIEKSKMSEEEKKKARTVELRRSSYRASRMFQFVEKMNINDFVIVPYKGSDRFLIGIVTSECFTAPISRIQLLNDDGEMSYDTCNFSIKRRVLWIKELSRKQFPDSLSWIKTAHQSLFDISEYSTKLNPYIYPIYRYNGKVYFRIGVNTSKQISSSSWLEYQQLLKNITGKELDNLYQKQKVQSPGEITVYTIQNYWWLIPLVLASLFGEVEIDHGPVKMKFQGILRFFSKSEKLKRQLAAEKIKAEVDQKKANVTKTDIKNLNALRKVTDNTKDENIIKSAAYITKAIEARQDNNEKRIDIAFTQSEEEKNLPPLKDNVKEEAEKVVEKFKLSNENPGTLIQYENQEDSLNVPMVESDKKEEK